jgi:hypothetical protein
LHKTVHKTGDALSSAEAFAVALTTDAHFRKAGFTLV